MRVDPMAKGFLIRSAQVEDAGLIAPLFDLYRQFYGKSPDPMLSFEFIRDRLQAKESVIFLAEAKTPTGSVEPLGFVQLYPSFSSVAARRILVLNDIFVKPEARGSGVGRALMEAARQHALQTGAKRLTLETISDNRTAWLLYESLGYVWQKDPVRFYSLELG
jgi:ribosomal protein S18 acetylase RimI-like enzyme